MQQKMRIPSPSLIISPAGTVIIITAVKTAVHNYLGLAQCQALYKTFDTQHLIESSQLYEVFSHFTYR
jgi:hypothetical protein